MRFPGCGVAGLLAVGLTSCGGAPAAAPESSPPTSGTAPPHSATASARPVSSVPIEPPPIVAPPVPVSAGSLGGSGPVALRAVAPDRRWLALCQANEDSDGDGSVAVTYDIRGRERGDRFQLDLLLGDTTTPIARLLGFDDRGRWLVLQKTADGPVLLLDSWSNQETPLPGLDTRDDAGPDPNHRAITFDAPGKRLAYVTGAGLKNRVQIRDLERGTTREFDPGGEVFRVTLEPTGVWVVLHLLIDDTSGNGKLDWPIPPEKTPALGCGSPTPRHAVWPDRGDKITIRVARLPGKVRMPFKVQKWRDLVFPLGRGLVLRSPGGSLNWRSGPTRRELSPESCSPIVHHADPERELLVAGCAKDPGRQPLWLLGPTTQIELKIDQAAHKLDSWPEPRPRLLPLYPGAETVLLDLDKRALVKLKTGDLVLHTHQTRALIQRGKTLYVFDRVTGKRGELALKTDKNTSILRAGRFVWVSPVLVDLEQATAIGSREGPALALSRDGQLLVATQPRSTERAALGPLGWKTPGSSGPDSAPSPEEP